MARFVQVSSVWVFAFRAQQHRATVFAPPAWKPHSSVLGPFMARFVQVRLFGSLHCTTTEKTTESSANVLLQLFYLEDMSSVQGPFMARFVQVSFVCVLHPTHSSTEPLRLHPLHGSHAPLCWGLSWHALCR
mgnify:CR=1 FL=1